MESQPTSDERRDKNLAKNKAKRERAKKRKAEEKVAPAALTVKKSKKDQAQHPPKGERRDWVATRASLVFDERGTGHTPDGLWLYYPRPSSHDVLPAGHAAERAKWMFLGFEEEGPNAREILPSTDQESEKGDDIEMGGMEGPVDKNNNEVERGKGGGDALVGVEVGVAGLALSTIVAQ